MKNEAVLSRVDQSTDRRIDFEIFVDGKKVPVAVVIDTDGKGMKVLCDYPGSFEVLVGAFGAPTE